MISFEMDYPAGKKAKQAFCQRFGLNAYYAGKHWTARRRDAEQLHAMAEAAMRKAGIFGHMFDSPVRVRFLWDDGLDVDNHAVFGKCVVDAMKGNIIRDDNRKWLKAVTHEAWDGGSIRIEIEEDAV